MFNEVIERSEVLALCQLYISTRVERFMYLPSPKTIITPFLWSVDVLVLANVILYVDDDCIQVDISSDYNI